jgi:hypothetical protein
MYPRKSSSVRLVAFLVAAVICFSANEARAAVQWRRVGTVAGALTSGQICYTNGTDIVCDTNSPTLSGTNLGIGSTLPAVSLDLSQRTDAVSLPSGTTGQRPTGIPGMIRYNSTSPAAIEAYVNGAWSSLLFGGGGTGIYLGASSAAANPARSASELNTGLYSANSGEVDVGGLGTQIASFTSSGINIGTGGLKIGGQNGISYPLTDTNAGGSVAIGSSALAHESALAQTAFYNTAIGYQTLSSTSMNASATGNTAVGAAALAKNTGGYSNTSTGYLALYSNTNGNANVADGVAALQNNTSGANNVAVGIASLYTNSNGSGNIAIGVNTLNKNYSGSNNIAIGPGVASTTLSTGSYNILIGTDGSTDATSSSAANTLNIGNAIYGTNLLNSTNSGGVAAIGVNTNAPASTLSVNGGVAIGTTYAGTNAASNNNLIVQGAVAIGTSAMSGSLNVATNIFVNGLQISNYAGSLALPQGIYLGGATFTGQNPSGSSLLQFNSAGTSTLIGIINNGISNVLRIGNYDAATASAQGITVQNVLAGNANAAGANFTISGSQGTGTGTGGAIVFQTAPIGSSGTAQNAEVEAMRITGAGNVGIGTASPGSSLQVNGGAAVGYATNTAAPSNGLAVSGSVGVGTTTPATGMKADIAGPVKVAGTGSESCTAATYGAMRYNSAGGYFEVCGP